MISYYIFLFCFLASIAILSYLQIDIGSDIIRINILKGWKSWPVIGARFLTVALVFFTFLIYTSSLPLLEDFPVAIKGDQKTYEGIVDYASISRVPFDGLALIEFVHLDGHVFIRALPMGERFKEAHQYKVTYLPNSRYVVDFELSGDRISDSETK